MKLINVSVNFFFIYFNDKPNNIEEKVIVKRYKALVVQY